MWILCSVLYLHAVFIYKHTPVTHLTFMSCNQMTVLTELKGQNGTHKQQRHVKGKRQPHKQQDGGYGQQSNTDK